MHVNSRTALECIWLFCSASAGGVHCVFLCVFVPLVGWLKKHYRHACDLINVTFLCVNYRHQKIFFFCVQRKEENQAETNTQKIIERKGRKQWKKEISIDNPFPFFVIVSQWKYTLYFNTYYKSSVYMALIFNIRIELLIYLSLRLWLLLINRNLFNILFVFKRCGLEVYCFIIFYRLGELRIFFL